MGDMFGILSPRRCQEGNGATSISILLEAADSDSLTDIRTALRSIQNDGNAFHIH
jgi:hypothetical protein